MKPKREVVATFNDLEKAQAVKLELEKAGFHSLVVDNSRVQRLLFRSEPLACDKVLVDETDFQKARHLLETSDVQDHNLNGEVRCLKCGSPHVIYPQFLCKFITPTVVGMLGSLLHFVEKEFYCQDCHYTWPVKEMLRPGTDVLNWPDIHRGLVKDERG
jgi:hypothetical protein